MTPGGSALLRGLPQSQHECVRLQPILLGMMGHIGYIPTVGELGMRAVLIVRDWDTF